MRKLTLMEFLLIFLKVNILTLVLCRWVTSFENNIEETKSSSLLMVFRLKHSQPMIIYTKYGNTKTLVGFSYKPFNQILDKLIKSIQATFLIGHWVSIPQTSGGNLAPSWGDGEIFRRPRLHFFWKNFHFSSNKFLMTFFSHRPGF